MSSFEFVLEVYLFHIGIKSLPKGSLPRLIGTIRGLLGTTEA